MRVRSQRGNNASCSALRGFQSFPPLPTRKLGLSGADSRVGGLVYILGPVDEHSYWTVQTLLYQSIADPISLPPLLAKLFQISKLF